MAASPRVNPDVAAFLRAVKEAPDDDAPSNPINGPTSYSYDGADRRVSEQAPLGRVTTTVYDPDSLVVATVDPLGYRTTHGFDLADRPVSVTDPLGFQTVSVLDPTGNVLARIDPLGRRASTTYDLLNRPVAVTNPAGEVSRTVYDAMNRVLAQVDGRGARTSFAYDPVGRRIRLTDANDQSTTSHFDLLGRELTSIDPLGRRTSFAYDAVGNRIRKVDPRGQSITSTYDADRRLLTEVYSDGQSAYAYDAAGDRTLAADGSGRYTTTYDPRRRPTQVSKPGGKQLHYAYDALDRRTRMTDPNGGRFTFGYDLRGLMRSVTNPRGEQTNFVYDGLGRQTVRQDANGSVTTRSYDPAGQLVSIAQSGPAGLVGRLTYSYDPASRRIGLAEATGARTTWSYEAAGQLTAERRSGTTSFAVTYSYDGAGNRTRQADGGALTTYAYDAANQLLQAVAPAGVTTYGYDAAGNRVRQEAPADLTETTWDARNRLVVADTLAARLTLSYDPDGLRVQKQNGSDTRQFIYDFERLLQETDGSGTTQLEYTQAGTDAYGELVSEFGSSGTLWHGFDAVGTTEWLADSAGSAAAQYAHRAFGVRAAHSGTPDSRLTFVGRQGYYADTELDLYYVRARYYDPAMGRWLSPDPKGFGGGDANLYRYVHNGPTGGTDPSGEWVYARSKEIADRIVNWAAGGDEAQLSEFGDNREHPYKVVATRYGSLYRIEVPTDKENAAKFTKAEIAIRNETQNGRWAWGRPQVEFLDALFSHGTKNLLLEPRVGTDKKVRILVTRPDISYLQKIAGAFVGEEPNHWSPARSTPRSVANMGTVEKVMEAMLRGVPYLPEAVGNMVVGVVNSPLTPVILGGYLAGHAFGASFVVDAITLLLGALLLKSAVEAADDLQSFAVTAVGATTEKDLETAGQYFARGVATAAGVRFGYRAIGKDLKGAMERTGERIDSLVPLPPESINDARVGVVPKKPNELSSEGNWELKGANASAPSNPSVVLTPRRELGMPTEKPSRGSYNGTRSADGNAGTFTTTDITIREAARKPGEPLPDSVSVKYANRNPDFSPFVWDISGIKGQVRIKMDTTTKAATSRKDADFEAADAQMASLLNAEKKPNFISPGVPWQAKHVAEFRGNNKLSWHHHENVDTATWETDMQLVKTEINLFFTHTSP